MKKIALKLSLTAFFLSCLFLSNNVFAQTVWTGDYTIITSDDIS